ncbi:hypothetical protein CPC735_032480 [Coccidioides posadasii C735 delta SOWgp]|uniref:Atos-like conserved domain-containing protein n=2 Tax=Coccidioides posadasii TaxID=199306 RepID=A0A0J6FG57_COCPO|nr:hypothetical protein CPC735_032480 [Coccidioides posadasii C735 delta SOWgp]EER27912.1 hypothetical protein CPC735_032480 [Coccidioides posadasii C735 delta SOWgp]KMM67884.1 hypothetical protein CPAG_04217 [Coccidioides posadasii RMSCC 3488]|eukprot:XP_003070057.1 hypothetical protein CPC735_032480 [Coccidioides posadasii C735 delta SOWgp]
MPIFQDPDRQRDCSDPPWPDDRSYIQCPADIELNGRHNKVMTDITPRESRMESENRPTLRTSSREELIQRIKRGESPTWVPSRSLEEYFAIHGDDPQTRLEELQKRERLSLSPSNEEGSESPERCSRSQSRCGPLLDSPIEIERPRSALHSGDFREHSPESPEKLQEGNLDGQSGYQVLSTSPPAPWYLGSPESRLKSLSFQEESSPMPAIRPVPSLGRLRPPSVSSFSANYVLKPPTSPLVHQANNPDLDMPHNIDSLDLSPCLEKANRRRTLPPEAFQTSQHIHSWGHGYGTSPGFNHREGVFSHQGHRPRRSLTSGFTLQPASSPQNSFLSRIRRPSQSSDAAPLHHASMVGSFEESILRGRMSMSPSKPLDFTAQVGVLGRGQCKANLKCPPHVTVLFPAVFYSYPTSSGGRTISDDSPSPYVGYIDIENSFPGEVRPPRKSFRQTTIPPRNPFPTHANEERIPQKTQSSPQERRVREKKSRRPQSPKCPPGGCYRIPQQGQLQIVIKNPNKTAVKLFLVPYDLEGMEPGTKTFVRQRSYSIGPAVDSPLTSGTVLDSSIAESSQGPGGSADDKPVLRYLIHVNICCPSKGRFYLYSGIRVVFANRVPDGKEKLRNEVHYPEPRYSPYKLVKDTSASMKMEPPLRRKSDGPGFRLQGSVDAGERLPSKTTQFGAPLPTPQPSAPSMFPNGTNPIAPREMTMAIDPDYIPEGRYVLGSSPSQSLAGVSFPRFEPSPPQIRAYMSRSDTQEETCSLRESDAGYVKQTRPLGYAHNGVESLLAQKLRNFNETKQELPDPEI